MYRAMWESPLVRRLREHPQWKFFGVLRCAAPTLAVSWWVILVLRAILPVALGIAGGGLISAVTRQASLTVPLTIVGIVFVALQVFAPLHQAIGANLGSVTAAWLNDELMRACIEPPGLGHLERSDLINDLTVARDFDLGIMGPPLSISMDFIASGLVEMILGIVSVLVLFRFTWWAPLVLGPAWASTHWLLRESGVWKDRETTEVRDAQRHAEYGYRLAVDPPAAKEIRLFGLGDWVTDRFAARRRRLYELRWEATRLRERSVISALVVILGGNLLVFWTLADRAATGRVSLASAVVFLQAAVGASSIAFGGLSWALDGAAAPAAAVARLGATMAAAGALRQQDASASPTSTRAPEIRFRDVTFAYEADGRPVLSGFNLTIPAGKSMAIVGVNGAGKTTLAKLLCRLYDPQTGTVESDGTDICALEPGEWRSRVTAVFQDFVRFELPLRTNVAPTELNRVHTDDAQINAALGDAGAAKLAGLDTVLARGYTGGTDLSGGQWQRIALARALHAVRGGARVVLLDEPTAQLDVRGEAEIFERVLAATRDCTTILISHRFSTVRQADRICVIEAGHVVELGSHDELMALDGRYRTMFDLQASRFVETDDAGEEVVYDTL